MAHPTGPEMILGAVVIHAEVNALAERITAVSRALGGHDPPVETLVLIVAATKPIDCRKGYASLGAMAKNELRKNLFTGTVFVFRAKQADRLKLLYWDGTGLVMAGQRR